MTIANIRTARMMSEQNSAIAERARLRGDDRNAEIASAVARTLHAISAAYTLPLAVVRTWERDERALASFGSEVERASSLACAEALGFLAGLISETSAEASE
jgi:hypothetical protein